MERRACAAAAGLAAALLFPPARALADDVQKAPPTLEGRYIADGDAKNAVTITRIAGDAYHVTGPQWEGVGFFDGTSCWGVFRESRPVGPSQAVGASGTHRGTLQPDGSLFVHGEYTHGRTGSFDSVWSPARAATPRAPGGLPIPRFEHSVWPPESPPANDRYLKLGEYVYVEELPVAITTVPPVYPEAARKQNIDGTVLVQALVGEDGLVKDVHVVKSIPPLDEAAMDAVRQWVFKPARTKGKPVAVSVAVPVKFTLH